MPKRQNKQLALFLCPFSMFPAIDNQVDMHAVKILAPSGVAHVASLSANC